MKLAVFTKNRTNPAYEAARLGADRAAKWLGAETQHFVPQTGDDPEQQSALVDEALALAPDAFVFTPVHATRVNAALERIAAARIPLFGFVNPIPAGPCVSYVGSDDERLAFEAAKYLFRHLGGHGRVLVVSGPEASVTSLARLRGYAKAAESHAGITLLGPVAGDYLRETARDATAQWLATHEAPDGALVANDIMAVGVVEALRAAGPRAPVVGVNAIPQALAAIRAGDMLATADFNAMRMAFLATECAVRHLRGEAVPARIELPVQIVDCHNAHLWDLPFERRPVLTLEELTT